MILKDLDV